jgi:uncharacterized phage protein (predicted DNA packaging)
MVKELVTLSEVKEHLRIEHTNEDRVLKIYIEAANDYIKKLLNSEIPGIGDSPPTEAPGAIKAGALLTIGDLYENREGASEKDIKENPAVMRLLHPYRQNMGM